MKTRLLLFFCLLLALALFAGCASREAPSAPAEATARIDGAVTAEPAPPPEASDEPAAEATGEPTPCPHEKWENGVCAACGERCAHPAHDAETRLCSVCGEAVPHSYSTTIWKWADGQGKSGKRENFLSFLQAYLWSLRSYPILGCIPAICKIDCVGEVVFCAMTAPASPTFPLRRAKARRAGWI